MKPRDRYLVNNVLRSFHVKSEDELQRKLALESFTLPCEICHKEFPIENISFVDGNPRCSRHKNC
jgi:hypothetical protein